jgi:hypothetical protein
VNYPEDVDPSMEIKLEITLSKRGETIDFSKVVNEGESMILAAEGDSDWEMEIVPEDVIQAVDAGSSDDCPVCGDLVDDVATVARIGETIDVDRVCIDDPEIEDGDCSVYFHQGE